MASPYINHFLQPDTIIPDPSNPQNWNRYSYVYNNPTVYNDPTGHCGEPVTGTLCLIAVAAIYAVGAWTAGHYIAANPPAELGKRKDGWQLKYIRQITTDPGTSYGSEGDGGKFRLCQTPWAKAACITLTLTVIAAGLATAVTCAVSSEGIETVCPKTEDPLKKLAKTATPTASSASAPTATSTSTSTATATATSTATTTSTSTAPPTSTSTSTPVVVLPRTPVVPRHYRGYLDW